MLLTLVPIATAQPVLRTITTRHYAIHTDLDADLADDLARRMDAMYDEYAKRLITFQSDAEPQILEVYLFKHRTDYLAFTSPNGALLRNTGGVFSPGKKYVAAFLEHQGRDSLRRTLQHEAFHQFAFMTIGDRMPIWLNEGIAQLFEEGLWTGDRFLLGQVPPRRVRQLQADLSNKRLMDFHTFMGMSPEGWALRLNNSAAAVGATQYNQAWAMVHFLVNATDDSGQPKYRARLVTMLRLLHDGQDAPAAFRAAFSDNIDGFHDRFTEYARQLSPTPEATFIEHQDILADMLAALDARGRHEDSIEEFRDDVRRAHLRIEYTRGQIKWTTDPATDTYFSDLHGRLFPSSCLFFQSRFTAPLPDIVCRCDDQLQLRARFYRGADQKIEHEVLIEPPTPPTVR